MTLAAFTPANILAIAYRIVGAFMLAFLAALPTSSAGWHVAIVQKAAYAGLFAAVALVQSLLWTFFSGQPQITSTARAGTKALTNG